MNTGICGIALFGVSAGKVVVIERVIRIFFSRIKKHLTSFINLAGQPSDIPMLPVATLRRVSVSLVAGVVAKKSS
jgi:hypothetical protein